MKRGLVLLAVCFFSPFFAYANVYISEVAWMGSADNANAEWIELYNDGTDVDVTNWTLRAIDGQPSITLSGTIGAHKYALLERTSDDTVPQVPAFLVYIGALGNDGEVLELRDANGVLQDKVDGSNGWEIGGNNVTKETLQRAGNPPTGGWSTGAPTPHGDAAKTGSSDDGGNITAESDETNENQQYAKRSDRSGGGVLYGVPDASEVVTREPTLVLDIVAPETVTVGVPATFTMRTYRESGREVVLHNGEWNMGDGTVLNGRSVKHTYRFPGTYVVVVRACVERLLDEVCDTQRVRVHAVDPSVRIASVTNTYIEVENTSNNELDLSGFVLFANGTSFKLPAHTVLLPHSSVRFPRATTGVRSGAGSAVSLYHPSASVIARYVPKQEEVVPQRTTRISSQRRSQSRTPLVQTESGIPGSTTTRNSVATVAYAGDVAEQAQGNALWWWLLGLGAIILIAIAGILLSRRETEEIIEGFIIESDE